MTEELAIGPLGLNVLGRVPFSTDPLGPYDGPLVEGFAGLQAALTQAHQRGPIRAGMELDVATIEAVGEPLGGALVTMGREFAEQAAPPPAKRSFMAKLGFGPRPWAGWTDIVWWASSTDGELLWPPYSIAADGKLSGAGRQNMIFTAGPPEASVTPIEAGVVLMHDLPSGDVVHKWRQNRTSAIEGLRFDGMVDDGDRIARAGRALRFVLDHLTAELGKLTP